MQPFIYQSRLRFVDTDPSGRIHNSAIFRYFDAAEAEFLRSIGLPYGQVVNSAIVFPRVHVEADFMGFLGQDDLLEIAVCVERVGEKSFTLAFEVSANEKLGARGRIVVCAVDRASGRSCPLPEPLARALREHVV